MVDVPPFLWIAANLSAPTLWCLGLMLYADARCDRPLFWWSLPAVVSLVNGCAVSYIRARHAAGACCSRRTARRLYLGMAMPLNIMLTLLLAWISGISSDIAPLVTATPLSTTFFVLITAIVFAVASHGLTSLVLPWFSQVHPTPSSSGTPASEI